MTLKMYTDITAHLGQCTLFPPQTRQCKLPTLHYTLILTHFTPHKLHAGHCPPGLWYERCCDRSGTSESEDSQGLAACVNPLPRHWGGARHVARSETRHSHRSETSHRNRSGARARCSSSSRARDDLWGCAVHCEACIDCTLAGGVEGGEGGEGGLPAGREGGEPSRELSL